MAGRHGGAYSPHDPAASLARALARYRGDFLQHLPAVGDWHLEHRERWRGLYVAGQLALKEHEVEAGR